MNIETKLTTTHLSSENERRVDLLGFTFRFLQFTFMVPSEETRDVIWKRKLYSLVRIIMFLLYIPTFLGIALALYKYREDVEDITDILVSGSSFIIAYIAALYILKNWDDIKSLMVLLEKKSGITHPFVQSKANLLEIIKDTKRKCKLITKIILTAEVTSLISFLLKPLILEYLEDPDIIVTEEEYIKMQWKKMIYLTWLPLDPRNPMVFYSIYLVQAITTIVFSCHSVPVINFNIVVVSYAAMQFKLASKSISDIDSLTGCSKLRRQNDSEEEEYEKGSLSGLSTESHISDLSEICVNEEILVLEERESNEGYNYIRECIKLHQSAIHFATRLNDLFSPVFTMYFILPAIPLVVSTFQLALGGGLEEIIPYIGFSAVCVAEMFLVCWFGQGLIDESLAVEQAAYNMLWYEQSISVQKLISLIILRSQEAVHIKSTGFPNVSIETFSVIMNASYQWFTVLLNMLHE